MSSGIFRGLGDSYRRAPNVQGAPGEVPVYIFSAQVLDVCLDESHELYNEPSDIGIVRYIPYQPMNIMKGEYEEDQNYLAWPINRNFIRYPLPGEIVVVYMSPGDDLVDPIGVKQGVFIRSYYDQNVTIHNNPTYNINPEIKKDQFGVRQNAIVGQQEAEQRFDQKIESINSYKQDNKVKIFRQLRPYEGDFILQGRFGNTIRLSSTIDSTTETQWKGGTAGDPVMILRVDRKTTTDSKDLFIAEDINTDDATIMMCSGQKVELELACSDLKTWNFVPGADPASYKGAPSDKPKSKEEAAVQATAGVQSSDQADLPKTVDDKVTAEEAAATEIQNAAVTETPTPPAEGGQ